MRFILSLMLVAGLVAGVSPALGDDFSPPPWRGTSGSSWAQWEFNTAGQPIANPPNSGFYPAPDGGVLPYGTPTAQAHPGAGQSWQNSWDGRKGVWPLSGEIFIWMPNRPITNDYKDIQIQLTWQPQAVGNVPVVGFSLNQFDPYTWMTEESRDPVGNWFHSIYKLRVHPNPTSEWLLITGGINVDEVVVDTICVPEPATLGLLTIGGLALLRRRLGA
ncbi:MAG TPA: PEP-CTERM sorting domain-containing protein [Phycisphaerae bacterium]|nr:PEP-CTERM sorting domain-containing protein [Phycisphaerae bacterium]